MKKIILLVFAWFLIISVSLFINNDTSFARGGTSTIPKGCQGGPAWDSRQEYEEFVKNNPNFRCPADPGAGEPVPYPPKEEGMGSDNSDQYGEVKSKSCAEYFANVSGLDKLCGSGENSMEQLINGIANWIVGILGMIFVIMIVIAGIQMATSAGNPDAIKAAKKRIVNVLISLVLLLSIRLIMGLLGVI